MPLENMEGLKNVDLAGGIGGLFAGIRNEQAQRQNEQVINEQREKANLAALMTQKQEQMTPWEVALKEAEAKVRGGQAAVESDPAYITGKIDEMRGKGKTAYAEGQVAEATTQGTIDLTKARQQNETSLINAVNFRNSFEEALRSTPPSNDPLAFDEALKTSFSAFGIGEHPMVQQYLAKPLKLRQTFLPSLDSMLKGRLERQPATAAKLLEIAATGKWHIQVANIQAAAQKASDSAREAGYDNRAMIALSNDVSGILNNMRNNVRSQFLTETSADGPLAEARMKTVWLAQKNEGRQKGEPILTPQHLSRNYQNGKYLTDFLTWYNKKKNERSDALYTDLKSYEQYARDINAATAIQDRTKRSEAVLKAIESLNKRQDKSIKEDLKRTGEPSIHEEPKPKPITQAPKPKVDIPKPANVEAEVWNALTPAEKALWTKQ